MTDSESPGELTKKGSYKSKKDKKPGISVRTCPKLKDPNAPRKPRSAYVHFMSSRRSKYGTLKKGCGQKAINVILRAEWQSLSDEERQPFLDLASQERKEYEIELKAYEKTEQYRDFKKKNELFMQVQMQQQKMAAESPGEFGQLQEDTHTKDIKKKAKSKTSAEKKAGSDEMAATTSANVTIPIFSREFLDCNRKREAKLRSIRRAIGVAEAEKEALERTIEKIQANNAAYESQAAHDRKMAKEADHIIGCWMQVLRSTISETMEAYHLHTPEETVTFLTKLADGDAPNEDVLQAVKQAIRNASFFLLE